MVRSAQAAIGLPLQRLVDLEVVIVQLIYVVLHAQVTLFVEAVRARHVVSNALVPRAAHRRNLA